MRLEDLTQDEATSVMRATEACRSEELHPDPFHLRIKCESEGRKNLGRYLVLCRQARKREEYVRTTSREIWQRDEFDRLAVVAMEHAEEVRRLRSAMVPKEGKPGPGRFEVVDANGDVLVFDTANTERWGPVWSGEDYDTVDFFRHYRDSMASYSMHAQLNRRVSVCRRSTCRFRQRGKGRCLKC